MSMKTDSTTMPQNKLFGTATTTALALGAGLGAAADADAAVVDRTVNAYLNDNIYDLDVDQDGTVDFTFFQIATTGTTETGGSYSIGNLGVYSTAPESQVVGIAGAYSYGLAERLGQNEVVDSSRSFSGLADNRLLYANTYTEPPDPAYPGLSFGDFISYGDFSGGGQGYVGLQFAIGGDTHFAWASVFVNNLDAQAVLRDVAYETLPDTGIFTPVPLPGTLPFLATGAASLLAFRRRRQKRDQTKVAAD